MTLSNFRAQEVEQNNETKKRGHKETGSLVDNEISRPRKDIRSLSFSLSISSLSFSLFLLLPLSLPLFLPLDSFPRKPQAYVSSGFHLPYHLSLPCGCQGHPYLVLEKLAYANEFWSRKKHCVRYCIAVRTALNRHFLFMLFIHIYK